MGCEFFFGMDYDGFYLELMLNHSQHIKSMNDEFWGLLAKLPTIGKLEWSEGAYPSSDGYQQLEKSFRKNNSSILKFACSYIFQELENKGIDMGSIRVKWEPNITIEELIDRGIETFKIMYQLNYLLYKCQYLSDRRKQKK